MSKLTLCVLTFSKGLLRKGIYFTGIFIYYCICKTGNQLKLYHNVSAIVHKLSCLSNDLTYCGANVKHGYQTLLKLFNQFKIDMFIIWQKYFSHHMHIGNRTSLDHVAKDQLHCSHMEWCCLFLVLDSGVLFLLSPNITDKT